MVQGGVSTTHKFFFDMVRTYPGSVLLRRSTILFGSLLTAGTGSFRYSNGFDPMIDVGVDGTTLRLAEKTSGNMGPPSRLYPVF